MVPQTWDGYRVIGNGDGSDGDGNGDVDVGPSHYRYAEETRLAEDDGRPVIRIDGAGGDGGGVDAGDAQVAEETRVTGAYTRPLFGST